MEAIRDRFPPGVLEQRPRHGGDVGLKGRIVLQPAGPSDLGFDLVADLHFALIGDARHGQADLARVPREVGGQLHHRIETGLLFRPAAAEQDAACRRERHERREEQQAPPRRRSCT